MKNFTLDDIAKMEPRYRVNLVTALSGIKSANLIGSCNSDGQTNLAIFNSVMHIGVNPPLLSILVRPHTVARHTYENIKATGYFTINAVHQDLLEKAHQTSGKYAKGVSEFVMCKIRPSFSGLHPAPYVEESPIQIGLKLEEELHIKSNKTILLIGRIIEVNILDGVIKKDGHLELEQLELLGINGLQNYCYPTKYRQMPYISRKSIESK